MHITYQLVICSDKNEQEVGLHQVWWYIYSAVFF